MNSPALFGGHHAVHAGRLKYLAGLGRYVAQQDGAAQLTHTLPAAQRHGDAGAVHEGHAGEVQHQHHGERALDLPLQAGEQALGTVVIQFALKLKFQLLTFAFCRYIHGRCSFADGFRRTGRSFVVTNRG